MSIEPVYKQFPQVPIERRTAAFLIDYVCVWLVSSLLAGTVIAQALVFLLAWTILRVFVVSRNQGQSLGRWALDMKLLEARASRIPDLLALGKREGIIGVFASLAMVGLGYGLLAPITMLLLCSPLAADWVAVITDTESRQALHDRIAGTVVVQTRRGFSLDLRVKRLLDTVRRRVQK